MSKNKINRLIGNFKNNVLYCSKQKKNLLKTSNQFYSDGPIVDFLKKGNKKKKQKHRNETKSKQREKKQKQK